MEDHPGRLTIDEFLKLSKGVLELLMMSLRRYLKRQPMSILCSRLSVD
jgi:hypothetical protein